MRISVIIPTKNGGLFLSKLLRIICKQEIKGEVDFIIVDSGSWDDTVSIANEHGATVVKIPSNEFSHGRARNLGAAKAKGSYLVFCNQDIVPANRFWLQNLVAPLENVQTVGSYSRQIARAEASEDVRLFLRHYYPEENRIISLERTRWGGPQDVVLFSTVAAALRRDIWEKFRFNERIIMSEDQEIAYRLLLSGYLIAYQANSVVFHSHNYSISDTFRRFFDSGWSMTFLPGLRVNSPVRSLHYFTTMIGEIAANGNAGTYERLHGLIHFFAKTLGFSLGQLAPYLPAALCVMLSHTKKLVAS